VISRARIWFLPLTILGAWGVIQAQGPLGTQPRELHGQVNLEDGTPYRDGAFVKVEDNRGGMGAQVKTDSRGRFDVPGLEKSRYNVTVHVPGYRDQVEEADLDTIPRAYVRVTLHPISSAKAKTSPDATVSVNELNIPPAAQSEFEKGRVLLLDKNKPQDSIAHFRKALTIEPSYAQASLLLGTAYMDLSKWNEAESALKAAISSDSKLGPAYLELGDCLISEKKIADAEQPLLKGLELNPDSSRGHYDLGRAYYSLNRYQEAESHARKAIELEPNFPDAHVLLGNVLLRLRNAPAALAEFEEYLRMAPNGPLSGPVRELAQKLKAALASTH
jgi:Flp pilus assembly protein TadD